MPEAPPPTGVPEAPPPAPVWVPDAPPLAPPATPPDPVSLPAAPPPAPPDPVAPPTALLSPAEPARDPARRRAPGGLLRLAGFGEYGALPGVTGGLALAGGLLWRRARVELHGAWLAPREVAPAEGVVRVSLLAGGLSGCGRLGRGALELLPCGGIEAGGLRGAATGPGLQPSAVGRWLAVMLGFGVAYRVRPRFGVWARLDGLAAIQRGSFVVRRAGADAVLFDPGVLSARLALGVELRLGDPR